MPSRTITYHGKKIRLNDEMFGYLEYALKDPKRWHTIGLEKSAQAAVKRLEKIGLVEIRDYSGHYRINPKF